VKRIYLCVLGAILLVACTSKNENIVQIGGIYALTGKAASYGKWVKNGVDLAVEEINQRGGVNGKKLVVIAEDTQSEPKLAVAAFEKLVATDKISGAIGFITSSEALACVPVSENNKVIMITPIASTPELKGAGKYVFRTRESGEDQSHKIADYIYKDLGIHEASVLSENAANAVGYKKSFIERYSNLGGKIQLDLAYDEGQTDFRSVLTRLNKSNPKAVYIPGIGKVLGRVLKQAKELGFKTRFFSSAGIEDPELFKIAGDAANGVVFGAPAFSLDSTDPPTRTFIDAYKKRFGEDPSVYSANAFDAIMLLVKAMQSGKITNEQMRAYLLGVKDYPGASGLLNFDEYGGVRKPIILKTISNGSFTILAKD